MSTEVIFVKTDEVLIDKILFDTLRSLQSEFSIHDALKNTFVHKGRVSTEVIFVKTDEVLLDKILFDLYDQNIQSIMPLSFFVHKGRVYTKILFVNTDEVIIR